ncbi:MAG: hypothetical protein ACK4NC_00080 [Candidatus Gracilibacteria bacterium]
MYASLVRDQVHETVKDIDAELNSLRIQMFSLAQQINMLDEGRDYLLQRILRERSLERVITYVHKEYADRGDEPEFKSFYINFELYKGDDHEKIIGLLDRSDCYEDTTIVSESENDAVFYELIEKFTKEGVVFYDEDFQVIDVNMLRKKWNESAAGDGDKY